MPNTEETSPTMRRAVEAAKLQARHSALLGYYNTLDSMTKEAVEIHGRLVILKQEIDSVLFPEKNDAAN